MDLSRFFDFVMMYVKKRDDFKKALKKGDDWEPSLQNRDDLRDDLRDDFSRRFLAKKEMF